MSRIEFLDQFRGFTVLLMIVVNVLAEFTLTPAWLKHSMVLGTITIPDFVITMFMFIIGVALDLAFFRSRERRGAGRTMERFLRRGLLLIAFGLLGSLLLGRDLIGVWGVFQTIGLAGIIALPFMFLPPRVRPVTVLLLVAAYPAIVALGFGRWLEAHDTGRPGGIPGGLAWQASFCSARWSAVACAGTIPAASVWPAP
jgi:predicted acyltransferase